MRNLFSSSWLGNILWFVISLILAFSIWVIATFQINPIREERVSQPIPIQIWLDDGLIVTERSRESAIVTVRAQESILPQIAPEDVILIDNLRGLAPGEHTVDLQAQLPPTLRAVVSDISPRRIRVETETLSEQLVPVEAVITADVPTGYERDEPAFDITQVRISGPSSAVSRVSRAAVMLDLAEQQVGFETVLRITPMDEQGTAVNGVTIEPASVTVNVAIRQSANFLTVRITPNINASTLPAGYFLTSLSYTPQTVLLTGAADVLATLPATLRTAPIDLTGRTEDFEVAVNVELPNNEVFVVSGESIMVSVGIDALTASRSFEIVSVNIIGLTEGLQANLSPDALSVLVTGPQAVVDNLTLEDVRLVLDLTGLPVGNYQLTPTVSISGGGIRQEDIVLLPTLIDVTIAAGTPEPTPESTPED
jgi:YbbR domain-containing protein